MVKNHMQHWDNYWQGRAAKTTGDALVGVGIEDNASLNQFWQGIFKTSMPETRLIDFACGAGSVLTHANAANVQNLTGVDISEKAIAILKTKFPNATGQVCPVDKTPFGDGSFDLIVSQFGFEYAGEQKCRLATAHEMVRILAPSGHITLVSHIKDGAIMRGCQQSLKQIKVICDTHFFDKAKTTFLAGHKANQSQDVNDIKTAQKAMFQLGLATEPIMVWLRASDSHANEFTKFIRYLLDGSSKIIKGYDKYEVKDGLSWFDGMLAETLAYRGRMLSMVAAALTQEDAIEVLKVFSDAGLAADQPEKLYFPQDTSPIAWILKANRHH